MDPFPTAPEPMALFLDFDGTLVDIAERPEAIDVPPGLPALLLRLSARLGGALAVVSGRPIPQLDDHLPVPIAKVGDHGGALRVDPAGPVEGPPLAVPPAAWLRRARLLADAFPGAFIEAKRHGFVLHYRQAPDAAGMAQALLEALVAEDPDHFTLMPARMAWEVMPRAVSKGTAVAALLARAPFLGRVPVFIGDDVTDEAGMAAARAAGGLGLRLQDSFGTPAVLRRWLARLAAPIPAGAGDVA
ncbi:trehalose-phosphatase [Falsiroseomonas stagni]|uniref:Trehalose 6-phosphate phosphatase n=1 Tax=Falsiroseomonas stagni DSM 19981 TaxID=1123062 RepID=A0A1I3XXA2_9PROT|nr:trehalose-phosphatase [Falsiroseomonas stagni]SFK24165.1 trehalose 6-phosphate phosphatase [Falsiroseomonas stagni DSM 19981]